MNKQKIDERWKSLLTAEILRTRLITCSIYLTAFHLLKSSIIDRIKSFFMDEFKNGQEVVSPDYLADVLARNCSPVHASLDWLKANGAVSENDVVLFGPAPLHRNKISDALHSNLLNENSMNEFPAFR